MVTIALVFLVRVSGALGAVALLYTAGRYGGVGLVGVIATLHVIAIGSAIISSLGAGQYLNKVAAYEESSRIGTLASTMCVTLILSLLVAAVLIAVTTTKSIVNTLDITPRVGIWFLLSVPALTLGYLLSGFLKGVGKPAYGVGLESGTPALLCSIVVLILNARTSIDDDVLIGFVYFICSWATAALGIIYIAWRSSLNDWKHPCKQYLVNIHSLYSRTRAYHFTLISNFLHANAYVLIVSMQMGVEDVGTIRVAERLAMLVSFPLTVINAIYGRYFSVSHYERNFDRLRYDYKKSVLAALFLGVPVFLFVIILSSEIFPHFGVDSEKAWLPLAVLSGAHLVNIATGSIALMLNMTGFEKVVKNITVLNAAISLPVIWIIADSGVLAVSLGVAFFLILQNIILFLYGRRCLFGNNVPV